jgi:probable rRNA maturation factor
MKPGNPTLALRNAQRAHRLDLPLVRRMTTTLLRDLMGLNDFDLSLLLVGAAEMTRLNQTFLHHAGPTDVLSFDYLEKPGPPGRPGPGCAADSSASLQPERRVYAAGRNAPACAAQASAALHGEIVICVDEALAQARRFRTPWQSELARYLVHGILHLRGFDDRRPAQRRKMKRAEDRFLRQLACRFDLRRLSRGPNPRREVSKSR